MCRQKKKEREIQKKYNWGFKDEASGSLLLRVKAMETSVIPVSDTSLLARALDHAIVTGWCLPECDTDTTKEGREDGAIESH